MKNLTSEGHVVLKEILTVLIPAAKLIRKYIGEVRFTLVSTSIQCNSGHSGRSLRHQSSYLGFLVSASLLAAHLRGLEELLLWEK